MVELSLDVAAFQQRILRLLHGEQAAVVAGYQTQFRQSFDMIGVIQIGIIRNELINQMIEYALENMDDTQK